MLEKPRLDIHIGTHKTGSTSLQFALLQKQSSLLGEGVAYIPTPVEFPQLMKLEDLDRAILSSCSAGLRRQVDSVKRRSTGLRYILSSEGLSGDPLLAYQNSGVVAQYLREITKDFDVYILVYLRRQDEFIESLYTQKIHEGEAYSFKQFVASYPVDMFNWDRVLRSYSDCFGREKMLVRRYDKSSLPEKTSILTDFSRAIGIRDDSLQIEATERNRGYSGDALEIARLSNPYLDPDEKKRLRHILQAVSSKQPFESYCHWDSEMREGCLASYSESNSIVAQEYFNDSSGILFPSSSSNVTRQPYQGLSVEAIAIVLAKAMLGKEKEESLLLRTVARVEGKAIALLRKRCPRLLSGLKWLACKCRLM